MKKNDIEYLADPDTRVPLEWHEIRKENSWEVEEGTLRGRDSGKTYAVKAFIPRFVEDSGYNQSFGEQWNRYRRTQIDRFNGTNLTRERFFRGTGWEADLSGQKVLEAGCGAGRFTQILLEAGAEVYSMDYSHAVDACLENHGVHERLHLFQADINRMPFLHGFFDKIFCYGVLQHTPDVRKAFMSLIPFLKPGGRIAIDVYRSQVWIYRWTSKYWYRWFTKRLPHERLFHFLEWFVPRWIPFDNRCQRNQFLRWIIPAFVPCWNYTGILGLSQKQITEWGILDTFDALASWHDHPQRAETVRRWFREAGLGDIDVRHGGNGILGNAIKPAGGGNLEGKV